MRKLIVSEFMSLDGVMQAPGGKVESGKNIYTDSCKRVPPILSGLSTLWLRPAAGLDPDA